MERPGLAAMVIRDGVEFDSLDGEPVTLLFLIAAPNTEDNVHLTVLSKLSRMLMDEEFTESLRTAKTPEEFLRIIDAADEEKKEDSPVEEEKSENQVRILAVTSCPTGIAHTYMAAEGIEKAAKAKGCEKIAPVLLYPVFGILFMGLLMMFVVEPVMGGINTALNNGLTSMGGASKIVLGMILGGMMAIDMGGPFNKASYVFGTAAIAAGNYDIMAAVMIGGMVPPCAIALATILFKNKFTKEERESGPMNFIMGLAFITEGAIPYAAADPIHVLPSCIIGSGVAGAISMAFGCTLMAPHGGIFVVPVMGNALMYLVALVLGTLVSTVLLGLLKKKVAE